MQALALGVWEQCPPIYGCFPAWHCLLPLQTPSCQALQCLPHLWMFLTGRQSCSPMGIIPEGSALPISSTDILPLIKLGL